MAVIATRYNMLDYSYSPTVISPVETPPHFSHIPYFFTIDSKEGLKKILERPYSIFLEISSTPSLLFHLSEIIRRKAQFALIISTKTACHFPIAHDLGRYINTRFGMQDYKSLQIQTCLQEALVNAVVHGNLELKSNFNSIDTFETYYACIEERLTDPSYWSRQLIIEAWDAEDHFTLAITDQGKGFQIENNTSDNQLPHGRGLMLIQSLADRTWVGDNGNTLYMTFAY